MKNFKCIIVDEDKGVRYQFTQLIENYLPNLRLEGTVSTLDEAEELINAIEPDMIFLSTNLEDNCFEIFEKTSISAKNVIFTTHHKSVMLNALRFTGLNYIMKPLNAIEMCLMIDKVYKAIVQEEESSTSDVSLRQSLRANQRVLKPETNKIALPTAEGLELFKFQDILRCEADRSYCVFHIVGNRRIVVSKSLKEFEEVLKSANFIRVHKSNMINLHHVTKYLKGKGGSIVLTDGSMLSVAVRKKDYVLSRLQNRA